MDIPNQVHLLPTLARRPLAFRERPLNSTGEHPLVRRAHATVASLVDLDAALAGVDAALPLERRREAVRSQHEAVQVRVAALAKAVAAEREQAADLHRFLDHPKPVESAIEAFNDGELRQAFRELDEGRARPLWKAMGDGQNDVLLLALARFAMPTPDSIRAREVWSSLQRTRHPNRVQMLDASTERSEWAEGIVGQVHRVFDEAADLLGPSVLFEAA